MKQRLLASAACVLCVLLLQAALLFLGVTWVNAPESKAFPVRGVDVSAYQGEIDWEILAAQRIDFAYIKATEGSGFTDEKFSSNWENARKTRLKVGAYHFFSFDSPGETQAQHFIDAVSSLPDTLPPAVDIEFYGDKKSDPPDRGEVKRELTALLQRLEQHYGKKPVLYATQASYAAFLEGDFEGYPLWIRNVLRSPSLEEGREWTLWQYSHRQRLPGYCGEEKFIDMNAFYGSEEQLDGWARGEQAAD